MPVQAYNTTLTCVPLQGGGRGLSIRQLLYGSVQIFNTTLTCEVAVAAGSPAAPMPTLMAETVQQLQWGIQLLGQLQPSTINLLRDMSVPADGTWPRGLYVNRSMVLAGLPAPAPSASAPS